MFDVSTIRRQFPFLEQSFGGQTIAYLDNAATSQKPRAVLDTIRDFYEKKNGNVHRAMHPLAERATVAYEGARETVRTFLNAKHPEEIIFTKNATEAINLVAQSWGKTHLKKGDVVVLSILEHHSNIIPWMQLKEETGIEIVWLDGDDAGMIDPKMLQALLKKHRVKLLAITGQSNVLGTRPPLDALIPLAHDAGAKVLVDAAQLVAHGKTDVQALECDFLAFSGHKVYGPDGIGVLYAKREILEAMPPFLGGGQMIRDVFDDRFTPADIPARFEAGTPPVSAAVGLAAALEWLSQFPLKDREAHETSLIHTACESLKSIAGLTILGIPSSLEFSSSRVLDSRHSTLSFTIDNVHPHDLTELLGREGLCLRAGHHCAQPLHRRLGITASARLSVALYNTEEEILRVAPAIERAMKKLKVESGKWKVF